MILDILYVKDVPLRMTGFSHYWLYFMAAAIYRNLFDQKIPEILRGSALWRHGLSEVVSHSGAAQMTSHNKHHGGLHVMLRQRYKNAHSFIIKDQKCL